MINLPKLIGHRGVKNLSPENTIESIKLAKELRLDWVEFDVKVSKDLTPILFHDDCLERIIDVKGKPVEYNYSEIKKFDAGSFFFKNSTNIYIPTLEEVLLLCKNIDMNLNIELKPNKNFEKINVESIAKILVNSNFPHHYYFSSFDLNSLIMMKELLPFSNYGLLVDKLDSKKNLNEIIDISLKYNFFCCGLNFDIITSEIINKILKNNLLITVYSENNFKLKEANDLWKIGVKSIFIDDPREFNLT